MATDATPIPVYRPFPDLEWRNAVQRTLEIPILVRLLRLQAGGKVLEVGCGRGIGLQSLARLLRPEEITGIDVDRGLLGKAESDLREHGVRARLLPADVRDLPFEDAAFDTVFDFGTCYHVHPPRAALREIARVLRPGGLFVHESTLAQAAAHPTRTSRRALPWDAVPELRPCRSALLWCSKRKVDPAR
jgi:ubiquinone/menaquinone biosynthesis C-methylase UbiE